MGDNDGETKARGGERERDTDGGVSSERSRRMWQSSTDPHIQTPRLMNQTQLLPGRRTASPSLGSVEQSIAAINISVCFFISMLTPLNTFFFYLFIFCSEESNTFIGKVRRVRDSGGIGVWGGEQARQWRK